MQITIEESDLQRGIDAMADVLCWLRGFQAAKPKAPMPPDYDGVRELRLQLLRAKARGKPMDDDERMFGDAGTQAEMARQRAVNAELLAALELLVTDVAVIRHG